MREQIETIVAQVGERLIQFSDWIMVQMQRLLILMQRFWTWYQSINWPEIPLTPLQWVLLFYGVFGLIYVSSTPIFEASDELWHFGVVEHIRETGELPVQDPDNVNPLYRQEGSQPPLYYWIAAAISAPFDISDSDQYREPNPHAQAGVPGSFGNKNLVLHDTAGVPLAGTPLAVYAIRIASLLMGAATIWAVYQSGKVLAPHRPIAGLIAAIITAFNPMFIFIAGSVNNDNLVIMLNSFAIYFMLLTLRDGFVLRRSLAIAALVALAALTKLSALVLVPVIALAALWLANRDKDWRGLVILGGAMLVAWGIIAGWWYLRNIQLYGELFGTATMAAVAGPREEAFTLGTLLAEFQGFRLSYWGVFGAFNIQTTSIFYGLADLLVFISMFGVMFLVAQLISIRDFSYARRELTHLLFLLGIVLVGLIAFISWTAQTYASQGRLMFPFMAAISPLLAIGFVEIIWWILFLLSPPDRSFVRAGEAVPEPVLKQSLQWPIRIFGLFALVIPLVTIAPAYSAPTPIETLPDDVERVYARYDNVELIGYDHVDRRYVPGEVVRMTFYWRVLAQTESDQSVAIALVGQFGNPLGSIDTYPGAGTLRTSEWEEGAIYADSYNIRLTRTITGRYPFDVQVSWYEDQPDNRVQIVNQEDQPIESVLLDVGAVIASSVRDGVTGFASLNDMEVANSEREFLPGLRLRRFLYTEDSDLLTVQVEWEATTNLEANYTAFAHIVNENGDLVGQADIFPQLPTHYWRFGELYINDHPISFIDNNLPDGEYRVLVGWYENLGDELPRLLINPGLEGEADTFELLPITIEDGEFILPEFGTEDDEEDPEAVPEPDEDATEEVGLDMDDIAATEAEAMGDATSEASSD